MNEQPSEILQTYMDNMTQALEAEKLRRQTAENQYTKDSTFPQIDEKSMVEFILNVQRLLDRAYHLLSGHVIEPDGRGGERWADPKDDRLKIFSPYGVERIMNLLSLYISPEVILSIMDLDTINREVKNFGIEISDLIANRYEQFFDFPSPEKLYEELSKTMKPITIGGRIYLLTEEQYDSLTNPIRIKYPNYKQVEVNGQVLLQETEPTEQEFYNLKVQDLITEEELYYKCVEWSGNELRDKLPNYSVVTNSLLALVHANYRRSLNGETLKALRTITHISQNISGMNQPQLATPERKGILGGMFKPKT